LLKLISSGFWPANFSRITFRVIIFSSFLIISKWLAELALGMIVFEHVTSLDTENKLILNFAPVFSIWWLSFWDCDEAVAVFVRLLNESRSTSRVFFGRTNMDLNELDIFDKRERMSLFWFCCWVWFVDELLDDDEEDNENESDEIE
jgi:hypothetical protein